MAKKSLKRQVVKRKQARIGLRITLLLTWFLVGLYVGLSGWAKLYTDELKKQAAEAECSESSGGFEYHGFVYCTTEDVALQENLEVMQNLGFKWEFDLPNPLSLLLTAFACGVIGSLIRILETIIRMRELPDFYLISVSPALGGMTALMLLGILYIFPYVFSDSKILLKPTLIPFLCLFAGTFSNRVQKWFQAISNKVFPIPQENKGEN